MHLAVTQVRARRSTVGSAHGFAAPLELSVQFQEFGFEARALRFG